ncbi:hypothetical protein AB0F15_26280 [Amycolatopsis sp. NPDC026612]|uniref:hypothetical protein n=1 Tax=Amycolatopsis sp. NPDC026612 TaxID=3155466 RepID=UPI0033EEC370
MILLAVGNEVPASAWWRPGAAPCAITATGTELLGWSQSPLAGLLVTAVLTAVIGTAVVVRRAFRRLDAMLAEELGSASPDRGR